jgi:hypothetical protein
MACQLLQFKGKENKENTSDRREVSVVVPLELLISLEGTTLKKAIVVPKRIVNEVV